MDLYINLLKICKKLNLPQKEEKLSNDNWIDISSNQHLSENFIEEFQDKVNWYWVSNNQKLSEKFIIKYQDKIDWDRLAYSPNLTTHLINKFYNRFSRSVLRDIYKQNLIKVMGKFKGDNTKFEVTNLWSMSLPYKHKINWL